MLAHRYRIVGALGAGGSATVLEAVDRVSRSRVAIKVHDRGPVEDRRLRARHEARVLRTLDDPNVVRREGRWPASGGRVVLEHLLGEDLAHRLRRGPLPLGAAAAAGAQIASALTAVHRAGWLHRDVKPSNIVLVDAGGAARAVLVDFENAMPIGVGYRPGEFTRGTATYLSPEQAAGIPPLIASDVYALGLVLVEALTGTPAFQGSPVETAVARLHADAPVPLGVPGTLAPLLRAMTRRDPDVRPAPERVAHALRDIAGLGDADGEASPPASPGPPAAPVG